MVKIFALFIAALVCMPAHASYFGELNAPANTGMFGPTAGGNGTMTPRAAVPADIPNLNFSKITAGTVPIGQGGTGQTTATTSFDALSPLGAKGDTLVYNSTTGHNVKFTACADGDQIQFDSTVAGIGIKCVAAASSALTTNHIFVGAAGVAADVAMSGDASIVASGALTVNSVGGSTSANIGAVVGAGTVPINHGGTNSTTALNNNRVMKSSGGAIVEAAAITANRALVSDANGIPVHATTTDTEIGYVNGVTSSIQTQINSKLASAGTGLIEESDGHIIAPANYTYVVVQRATYAFTINSVDLQTSSGTITAALKINGTNVTSCNGIAVTSTPGLTTCTAANSVSVGDQVTLVTSANAASADLSFTVKETR